jgi:hypothetical protein
LPIQEACKNTWDCTQRRMLTKGQTVGKHFTHNSHLNVFRESTQEREIISPLSVYIDISHHIDLKFIREHTQCSCCLILLTKNVFTCFYEMKVNCTKYTQTYICLFLLENMNWIWSMSAWI